MTASLEERRAPTVIQTCGDPSPRPVPHLRGVRSIARDEELPENPRGRVWRVHKEFLIQLSKSHYPSPATEFADIDANYGDLCDDKTKIRPT